MSRLLTLLELLRFALSPRRLWLLLVLLALSMVALLSIVAASSPLSPLIYPLF